MTVKKSQIKATEKYNAKSYDDVRFRVKKGEKSELQAIAEQQGMSLNAFITTAISEYIKNLTAGSSENP